MSVDNPSRIMEATESFVCVIDGEQFMVHRGTTRVAASHALARVHPGRFAPVEKNLSYGDEMATENPGEQRARTAVASKGSGKPTEKDSSDKGS